MQDNNDDIKKLFQSFGADANSFRDLARNADAQAAEARWPLLSSVQPAKRELPPLLSKNEKSNSWTAPAPQSKSQIKAKHPHYGLAEKLTNSLQQQIEHKQTRYAATRASALQPHKDNSQPETQAPLANKIATRETSRASPLVTKKLFSSEQVAAPVMQHMKPPKSDKPSLPLDNLANIFDRITQATEDKTVSPIHKSLFGRIGRS